MDNIPTKIDNISKLTADEFNSNQDELENSVTKTGQVLGIANSDQLGEAMALYAATGGVFYTSSGSGNTYILTSIIDFVAPTAYILGMEAVFKADKTSTGAVTVNINGNGNESLTLPGGTGIVGEIVSGAYQTIRYLDSPSRFELIASSGVTAGLASVVDDTSPQLGGDLDANGNQIQWSKGADVASVAALAVLTDGNYFDVTGTTTITSINSTGGAGTQIKLHFDGALILTHNASSLILPGGTNITTAAGDEAEFIEYSAGDYRCTNYTRASGLPVVNPPGTGDVSGPGSADDDAIATFNGGSGKSIQDGGSTIAEVIAAVTAGAFGRNRTTVNDANYTVLSGDYGVALTAITAARTITIPTSEISDVGREFVITDESGDVDETLTLTIATSGSETISGAASLVLNTGYASVTLYSNGADLFIRSLQNGI